MLRFYNCHVSADTLSIVKQVFLKCEIREFLRRLDELFDSVSLVKEGVRDDTLALRVEIRLFRFIPFLF